MPKTLGSLNFRRKQFFSLPAWERFSGPIKIIRTGKTSVAASSTDRQPLVKVLEMPDKILTKREIAENRALLTYVKEWLRFRGANQRKLAEVLGMSESTVSKWLAGGQSVTVAQFVAIAKFLDAQPAELMTAPPDRETAKRYQRIAEVAKILPEEALDEWLAVGSRLAASNRVK